MFGIGREAENYFTTETKPHKQPLKNPTFQLKPNNSEMFEKHFLLIVVLLGCIAFKFVKKYLKALANKNSPEKRHVWYCS